MNYGKVFVKEKMGIHRKKPTSNKELTMWENKKSKAYALIAASENEEVTCRIAPFTNVFSALKKLKEVSDSHTQLEVVQLMIKLFNLELKDDDSLALASEIRAIMHDGEATSVKMDVLLKAFVKALYPTYSHYLESVQASVKLKEITFDSLVEKFAEREKVFGKRK